MYLDRKLVSELLSDYHVLTPGKRPIERIIKQPTNMRNLLKDEIAVAAIDGIELNMRIENAHLTSFANQLLEKSNDRTLSQIVGVFFERQTDDTQPARG